jgi:glycyl-tRNA synthetase
VRAAEHDGGVLLPVRAGSRDDRAATDRGDYSTFFQVNNVDNAQFVVQTGSDGTTLGCYIYDNSVTGTNLTAGTWYHIALTWDGTSARVYINGTLDITVTATGSDWNEVRLGTSYWGEPLNGNIAFVKAWDATFTAAQIQREMYRIAPVEAAALKLWMPTFDGTGERNADYSGAGNTLTVNGTITDYPNPPVSWGAPVRLVPFAAAGIDGDASITLAAMTASSVGTVSVSGASAVTLAAIIQEKHIPCPNCGMKDKFTDARTFNLLFKTHLGVIENEKDQQAVYLRGEIAQAMFVDFKTILNTTRKRLPFGIASVGKAFRNEITPGNFTFRTLEFDLMEFEYFIRPDTWEDTFNYWLAEQQKWIEEMGFKPERIRVREHSKDELSHYSKRTADVEYHTPFGWKEMFGLAYRTDFDLKNHMEKSGEDLQYTDPDDATQKFIPHVIEPTFGLSRLTLMLLLEAYDEEKLEGDDTRTVLRLHPRIAPVQVAILPLTKKENLVAKAQNLYNKITQESDLRVDFDVTGSIGKRYRRQDEIGTPKCITVDFGTLGEDTAQGEKDTVTIRDRDTLEQVRVPLNEVLKNISTR